MFSSIFDVISYVKFNLKYLRCIFKRMCLTKEKLALFALALAYCRISKLNVIIKILQSVLIAHSDYDKTVINILCHTKKGV